MGGDGLLSKDDQIEAIQLVLVTRSETAAAVTPGAAFTTVSFPSGVGLELRLDTGSGSITARATAPNGEGLEVSEAVVVAVPERGSPYALEATIKGEGIVEASAHLPAGTWDIDAVVTADDGRTFQATLVDVPVGA